MKSNYIKSGKLSDGLPTVFKDFVRIISNTKYDHVPMHERLIKMLMTEEDGSQMTMDSLFNISWNNLIDLELGEYFS